MATEPGTWSGLQNQAKAGYLKFDTADALAAARASADLVDDLLGMAAAVTNLRLDNFGPIGTLTSGLQLAMAFTNKGVRLRTILNDHADIVKDIGETYIAAGKAYANADGESSSNFQALSELKMPTEASAYTPGAPAPGGPDGEFDKPNGFTWKDEAGRLHTTGADAEGFPTSLKDYQGEKDKGVTASVENKDSLSFQELYDLGQGLDPAPVLAAAGTWHSMSTDLLAKLNTFVNAINTGTQAWEGQGATAAAAAIKAYSDGVQPLITSMIAMSQNLDYSAQWLNLTRMSMPSSPDPGDCCPGRVTRRYRDEWQKHYGEGMKNTVSAMPVVNGPIAEPVPQNGQGGPQPPGPNDPVSGHYGNGQYGDGQYGDPYGQYGNGQYGNGQYGNGQYGNGEYGDGQYGNGEYGNGQYGDQYSGGQEGGGQGGGQGQLPPGYSAAAPGPNGGGSQGSGGSGATMPNGARGGGSGGGSGSGSPGGSLPPGYEAARKDAEAAGAGLGGPPTPVGSSGGGGSPGGGSAAKPSSSGNPFPRSSLPGESGSGSGSGSSGSGAGMPNVPSLGSATMPNGAKGGSSGGGTGGGAPGSGAGMPDTGGLADALAKATGADPAKLKSMLGNLPGLVNEDTLAKATGLSPEQVRSVLKNIPKVADAAELAKLTGLSPDQVRSVLDSLPNALDDKAVAAATGLDPKTAWSSGAGLPGQSGAAASPMQGFMQAGKDFLGQIGQALTQGLGSLGQLPGLDQLQEFARRFDPAALAAATGELPTDPAGGAGGGSGSGGGAGGPGPVGGPGGLPEHAYQQSRAAQLFPRASLPGAEQPLYPAAASANPGMGGMGAPMMGGGGAGAGGAQGNTSHKPAKYLQSRSHLDDAIGAVPDRVKPVIDS
ncbi:hypothetical protein [Nocardia jiangsuensis]|uniref:PPE family protein n=1 Tax=Nocardia jiangsuensis TaxID=1691563 RepID=A0ABV8DM40_9NOCA